MLKKDNGVSWREIDVQIERINFLIEESEFGGSYYRN